ncbi:nucleoside monophosphate kinase [Candidatus Saccharibacteria bacterium]|nr:nucleoside monophosphate kinase [Candidatus Saccharibacteria bacterium]
MESQDVDSLIDDISLWLGTGSINIFGLPFSGKDTHGTELSNFFNAPLIGGGDILRSKIGPKHIKEHMSGGNLAPSEEYLAIVLPYLSQEMFSGHPLILNTVGRWHGEESSVMQAAEKSGHPIKAVIFLDVTTTEAQRRWQLAERGRDDDAAEHILEKRFSEFKEKTIPVIEFYRDKGLLIEIDGMPPQRIVTRDILDKLHKLATNS